MRKVLLIPILIYANFSEGMDAQNYISEEVRSEKIVTPVTEMNPTTTAKTSTEVQTLRSQDIDSGKILSNPKSNSINVLLPPTDQSWDRDNPEENYITVVFMRHGKDAANKSGVGHKKGDESEIDVNTIGTDVLALPLIGLLTQPDIIACGTEKRHKVTARALRYEKFDQSVISTPNFDEQDITPLFKDKKPGERISEEDIKKNKNFIEMISDRHKKFDGMESGQEVIDRFRKGIKEIINNNGIEKGLAIICSSRCSMSWLLIDLMSQKKFFPPNLSNCASFFCKYYPKTERLFLLKNVDGNPYILDPQQFIIFALSNKTFSQYHKFLLRNISENISEKPHVLQLKLPNRIPSVQHRLLAVETRSPTDSGVLSGTFSCGSYDSDTSANLENIDFTNAEKAPSERLLIEIDMFSKKREKSKSLQTLSANSGPLISDSSRSKATNEIIEEDAITEDLDTSCFHAVTKKEDVTTERRGLLARCIHSLWECFKIGDSIVDEVDQ